MGQILDVEPILLEDYDSGQITNGSSTKYSIVTEAAYTRNRWIKSNKTVWVKFQLKCTTPSNSWDAVATGLPVASSIHDGTTIGSCVKETSFTTVDGCQFLIQNGILYVRGGTANCNYYVDHCYVTD